MIMKSLLRIYESEGWLKMFSSAQVRLTRILNLAEVGETRKTGDNEEKFKVGGGKKRWSRESQVPLHS